MRMPRAVEGLVTQEIGGEVLAYLRRTHRVMRLNATAARALALCDGETPVAEAAARLARQAGLPEEDGPAVLGLALERLRAEGIVDPGPDLPTRRRFLNRAAVLPLVLAMAAPRPAHAQSSGCLVAADPSQACRDLFGAMTRVGQCVQCGDSEPCSDISWCITEYIRNGTSCLDDEIVDVYCNAEVAFTDCAAARADTVDNEPYVCCNCS